MDQNTSELDRQIGARLRVARNQAGVSLEQLSAQSNLTLSDLKHVEAGRKRLSAKSVALFSKLLDVEIRWFFGEASSAPWTSRPNPDLTRWSRPHAGSALTTLVDELARMQPDATKAA